MGFHKAQICLNGHVVATAADRDPDLCERFCSRCGVETMTVCGHFNASIRGDWDVPHALALPESYALPRFCHSCGRAYPWTTARLQAAAEPADELEGLSTEERETLKKRLVVLGARHAGGGARGGAREERALVDVLSEAAKKSLGI